MSDINLSAVVSALNNKADVNLENSIKASEINTMAQAALTAANASQTSADAATKVANAATDLIEVSLPQKLDKSGGGITGNLSVSGDLFVGGTINASISGTSENAVKASQDAQGNVIDEHYATKDDVNNITSIINSAKEHGLISDSIYKNDTKVIDLNTYIETGVYSISCAKDYGINFPSSQTINGFLIVYCSNVVNDGSIIEDINPIGKKIIKQIYYRIGTIPKNDHDTWARSLIINNPSDMTTLTASPWHRYCPIGVWVEKYARVLSVTEVGEYTVDLNGYLPDDDYCYDVMFRIYASREVDDGTNSLFGIYIGGHAYLHTQVDGTNFQQAENSGNCFVSDNHTLDVRLTKHNLYSGIVEALGYRRCD